MLHSKEHTHTSTFASKEYQGRDAGSDFPSPDPSFHTSLLLDVSIRQRTEAAKSISSRIFGVKRLIRSNSILEKDVLVRLIRCIIL
jgi:hypothetical protein